jgi:hypothetical protein
MTDHFLIPYSAACESESEQSHPAADVLCSEWPSDRSDMMSGQVGRSVTLHAARSHIFLQVVTADYRGYRIHWDTITYFRILDCLSRKRHPLEACH